ncbi:MAG: glycoside hydrolase family 3 C-terminal domain-containing protein [Blautia sp.]|nr:glycoside hydrolase family 3 C-terminal domain-containing protein [Blautia sp.]
MEKFEKEHIEIVRKLAPECMVLLKSDGNFPLEKPCKVALYGNGARRTIKGGTGSGDVNVRHYVTVEEGLCNAGFTITTRSWLDGYGRIYENTHETFTNGIKDEIRAKGPSAILSAMGAVMPEPDYELPMDGEGDAAFYILTRISGEGSDRQVLPGDFMLSGTEIRDIKKAAAKYTKFMLVLNTGGVIDLSPVLPDVNNILLLSQLGTAIGDAFADVVLGKAYPSGKLTATWAKWEDYCHEGEFGETDDTRYREGIYVGYRYFDSVGKEPLFPFGYGLSYTDFTIGASGVLLQGSRVTVNAQVKNTGDRRGREVLQLYVSIPEKKLDQPYQVLAAFGKTEELARGGEEEVRLSFDMTELACFDRETARRVLEAGDYVLRFGNSSRSAAACGIVHLEEDIVTEVLAHVGGQPDFEDWKPEKAVKACDKLDGTLPVLVLKKADVTASAGRYPAVDADALALAEGMSEEELVYLCTGDFEDEGSKSVIGNAGMTVAGAAGETTGRFLDKGIKKLVMADGPAGLRLSTDYGVDEQGVYPVGESTLQAAYEIVPEEFLEAIGMGKDKYADRHGEVHEQYAVAIPIGTAIAQSFNVDLAEQCGDMVAREMEAYRVNLWLAPALNIQRLPLCGRNFEYYSEDPLVSGKMAAAITRGVQKHPGCGTTIKHFAANNQETNRFRSNSILSERVLRDIYLKGFEIAVKESQPAAVMTSYNLLNGEHTSSRYDLNETVLRKEWGFEGIVMSDWVGDGFGREQHKYPIARASGAIKAGNDIMMPGTKGHVEDLMNALDNPEAEYPISREDLVRCAARMIAMARKRMGTDAD